MEFVNTKKYFSHLHIFSTCYVHKILLVIVHTHTHTLGFPSKSLLLDSSKEREKKEFI